MVAFAFRLGPAQAQEYVLDPAVGHTHDLGGAERTRAGRKQEMLRHEYQSREDKPVSSMAPSAAGYKPIFAGGNRYIRPQFHDDWRSRAGA